MVLSERLEEFLEKPNLGILATLRKDGSPHLTVVWYEWADGEVLLTVTDTRVKYKNVMRDPRVSLAVTANEHPYKEVVLEGIAEVSPEGGPELFRGRRWPANYSNSRQPARSAAGDFALKYDGAVEGMTSTPTIPTPATTGYVMKFKPTRIMRWDFALTRTTTTRPFT